MKSVGRGQFGTKTVDGKAKGLDKNGNIKVDIFTLMSDYPFVVVILALIMCVIALLLPGKAKYFMLAAVVLIIVYMTLIRRTSDKARANLELFYSYRKFFESYTMRVEILHNMWLFVPFGAVLYMLYRKRLVVIGPVLLSAIIELIQLVFHLGMFEFDDIVSNGLGGVIGVLIGYCLVLLTQRTQGAQGDGSSVFFFIRVNLAFLILH